MPDEENAPATLRPAAQASFRTGEEASGMAKALFRILARRGLHPSERQRAAIASCRDVAQFERWLDAALDVRTLEEWFPTRSSKRDARRVRPGVWVDKPGGAWFYEYGSDFARANWILGYRLGRKKALLERILTERGLRLTEQQRTVIRDNGDVLTVKRWITRARRAHFVDEVFE
jgi:hypothetical protein